MGGVARVDGEDLAVGLRRTASDESLLLPAGKLERVERRVVDLGVQ